jgi:Flp pilus assembly pilin Flp
MRTSNLFLRRLRAKPARLVVRFRRDCRGATAVEFAMVSVPFFAMMLAMMTVGTHYLIYHSLERGLMDASRLLRTGEAQKAGLDLDDFRKLLCEAAGKFVACDEHLVIHIKSNETFAGLSPPTSCVSDGALAPPSGAGSDAITSKAGEDSTAVQVTACYEWEMGASLWETLFNLVSPYPVTQGKTILSATTAFRSEPYQ